MLVVMLRLMKVLVMIVIFLSLLVTVVMLMSPEGEYVEVFDKRGIGRGLQTVCDVNDRILEVHNWNKKLSVKCLFF